MHPQTLRMYEARGLIEPKRSPKGTRLYSQDDVERLRRIQEMTAELGLNLAGVERVLRSSARSTACTRASRSSSSGAAGAGRAGRGAREVRRSFRAELVPYRSSTARRPSSARPRGPIPARPREGFRRPLGQRES